MMKQNILGMSEEEEQGQTDIEFDSRTLGTGSMCASPRRCTAARRAQIQSAVNLLSIHVLHASSPLITPSAISLNQPCLQG